jgi:hypothetical protein
MDTTEPVPAPAPAPKKTWDAVLFGPQHQQGKTHHTRVNKACDMVEPFLGSQPFISDIGGSFFARKSPKEKYLFLKGDDREGECRYTWEDGPNGLKLGTLKEGA